MLMFEGPYRVEVRIRRSRNRDDHPRNRSALADARKRERGGNVAADRLDGPGYDGFCLPQKYLDEDEPLAS
jgi:hypothetical protein